MLLALLGGWEALVRAGGVDELILPAPTQVLQALWEDRSLLAPDLWTTTYEVVLGLLAATVSGAALGAAMHLWPGVRRALHPLVIGSQAVPVPVLAPLVILVFGFGLAPKVLLVALVCFFPITINLYDGLRAADPDARRLLRSLQATRWQSLRLVEAPAALPAAFTGLKVAAAVAVIGAVFAEWAGAESGLGRTLITANGQLATARAFAAVLLLFLLAIALYARLRAARAARGRLAPTHRSRRTMTRRLRPAESAGCSRCSCCSPSCPPAARSPSPTPASVGAAGKTEPLRVMLDYFPNADHAGIYAARETGAYAKAGLDVTITPPPDPSAPLKLLLAGRTDIAVSYEPELLLARDKGAELVSVGALVQQPLTSLMAVGKAGVRTPRDLRGKRVGTSGIPYQSAYLKTILDTAGVDPGSVKETNVGFNLVPAMLSGKVDATLGAFWNYEGVDLARRGRKPVIQRMEKLGVPTYAELVFVVRRRDLSEEFGAKVRRFMQATARGHVALREDPDGALDGLMQADKGLDRGLQEAVVEGDAARVLPGGRRQGVRLPGPGGMAALHRLDGRAGPDQRAAERRAGDDERVPGRRRAGSAGRAGAGLSSPAPAARTRCAPASAFQSP